MCLHLIMMNFTCVRNAIKTMADEWASLFKSYSESEEFEGFMQVESKIGSIGRDNLAFRNKIASLPRMKKPNMDK